MISLWVGSGRDRFTWKILFSASVSSLSIMQDAARKVSLTLYRILLRPSAYQETQRRLRMTDTRDR